VAKIFDPDDFNINVEVIHNQYMKLTVKKRKLVENLYQIIDENYTISQNQEELLFLNGNKYTIGNIRGFLKLILEDDYYDDVAQKILNLLREHYIKELQLYYYTPQNQEERNYVNP